MVLRALAAAFVVLVTQAQAIKPPDVDLSGSWSLLEDGKLGISGSQSN